MLVFPIITHKLIQKLEFFRGCGWPAVVHLKQKFIKYLINMFQRKHTPIIVQLVEQSYKVISRPREVNHGYKSLNNWSTAIKYNIINLLDKKNKFFYKYQKGAVRWVDWLCKWVCFIIIWCVGKSFDSTTFSFLLISDNIVYLVHPISIYEDDAPNSVSVKFFKMLLAYSFYKVQQPTGSVQSWVPKGTL